MRATCELVWRSLGPITVENGELTIPELPIEPGIYLLTFEHQGRRRCYVGEASNLRRRFAHYRRPGPWQWTNLRMHERTCRVAAAGGSIELAVAEDVQLEIDGRLVDVDLGSEFVRRLAENAALVELMAGLGEIVNGKGSGELRLDEVLR